MKFIDEYRDGEKARPIIEEIHRLADDPIRLMEVCGTHTVSIARYGLREILPEPSSSSPARAAPSASPPAATWMGDFPGQVPGAIVPPSATWSGFPDLIHPCPGTSRGADVRVVYSPLDAPEIGRG